MPAAVRGGPMGNAGPPHGGGFMPPSGRPPYGMFPNQGGYPPPRELPSRAMPHMMMDSGSTYTRLDREGVSGVDDAMEIEETGTTSDLPPRSISDKDSYKAATGSAEVRKAKPEAHTSQSEEPVFEKPVPVSEDLIPMSENPVPVLEEPVAVLKKPVPCEVVPSPCDVTSAGVETSSLQGDPPTEEQVEMSDGQAEIEQSNDMDIDFSGKHEENLNTENQGEDEDERHLGMRQEDAGHIDMGCEDEQMPDGRQDDGPISGTEELPPEEGEGLDGGAGAVQGGDEHSMVSEDLDVEGVDDVPEVRGEYCVSKSPPSLLCIK